MSRQQIMAQLRSAAWALVALVGVQEAKQILRDLAAELDAGL